MPPDALTVIVYIVALHVAVAQICPEQKQTGIPQFTEQLTSEDMVRWGTSIAVRCCAEGYDNITWYRKEASDWVLFPPVNSGSSVTPTVEEKQQVLRIHDADMSDSTFFRCDLFKDGLSTRQHQMKLIVQRCDVMARGPIPTEPSPKNTTIKNLGVNVTLYCTGYFGCGSDNLRIADWLVKEESGNTFTITNNSNKYVTHGYSRNDETTIGSSLTINDIQPEDLKRTYLCRLSSAQIHHGTVIQPVHISKAAIPSSVSKMKIILITAGGFFGLVILITVTIVIIMHYCGPQVILFVKSHLPRCKPAPERGDKEFNALMYHAEGDESIAADIRNKMQKKGYNIFISYDLQGNRSIGDYERISDQSLIIMFLHTKNLQEDPYAHLLLQSLISNKRAQDIIFLVVDKYDPEKVMESTTHANHSDQNENVRRDTRDEGHREVREDGLEEGDGDANSVKSSEYSENSTNQNTNSQSKDLSFWKALPRCSVPLYNASERKKLNFICWLQNKIPKFQDQLKKPVTDKNKRRTSSGRQLLASQAEESVTPTNLGTVNEDDNVFTEERCEPITNMQNGVLNIYQKEEDNTLNNSKECHLQLENEVQNQFRQTEDVTVAVVHEISDETNLKFAEPIEIPGNSDMRTVGEESRNTQNESSPLLPLDRDQILDKFLPKSQASGQDSLASNISESSGIGSSTSGAENSISARLVDSYSRSQSPPFQDQSIAVNQKRYTLVEDNTRNGKLGNSLDFSRSHSCGESGYGTTPDQNLSPELKGNSMFSPLPNNSSFQSS